MFVAKKGIDGNEEFSSQELSESVGGLKALKLGPLALDQKLLFNL